MGLTPVDPYEVAAIVTALEMRARPALKIVPGSTLSLQHWAVPTVNNYCTLYKRVGAPWLWFSRLILSESALTAIIHHPAVEIYAVIDRAGIEVGIIELDFRVGGQCEIAFFGLIPELAGKGHGRWMMAHTINLGWRDGIERLWVHTCSLDSPSALGFYQRSGFTPYERSIETFADPRLLGILPRESAPHIPCFTSAAH
jgi:GNAT superfamily N-acetyltransferase